LLYAQKRLEVFDSLDKKKGFRIFRHNLRSTNYIKNKNEKEIMKVLKASEIPMYKLEKHRRLKELKNDKRARSKKLGGILEMSSSKDESGHESDESVLSMDSTMDEFVDEEEFLNKDMDTKKNTFRVKIKARERRFSRI